MTRHIAFFNDYSMEDAYRRWRIGDYPGHHLWGMNMLAAHGWDVAFMPGPRAGGWRQLLARTGVGLNGQYQIARALRPPRQPNCYFGSFAVFRIAGLLKSMGLFRRRAIVMVHHPVAASAVNRRALHGATALFFLNRWAYEQTVAAMPEIAAKSHVVGWCLDSDFYDARSDAAVDPKLIVAAGKVFRDYDTLIAGVKLVDDPELRVEIYCSPESAPTLTDPRVTVTTGAETGEAISYRALLARCASAVAVAIPMWPIDLTIGLTSIWDGLGSGRAVLVTRHACIDAPLEDGSMGHLVEAEDPESWAAALRSVLADPSGAVEAGRRGRRWADAHLSPERYGTLLDGLFARYFAA